MHFGIFTPLISTFLLIHGLLYNPVFPKLPSENLASIEEVPLTLSVRQPNWVEPAPVQATSAFLIDQKSAEILYEKNPDQKLPPASTTKIMTALIVLEEYDLSSVASISAGLARDGSGMGLIQGEKITVKDLLAGLLIPSANDAADQLSKMYPGGTDAFVSRMNARAHELGLKNTTYVNPTGYEQPLHLTTVRDLAILTRVVMQNPTFSQFVRIKNLSVKSVDGAILHNLRSTNELLTTFQGIEGVKTGWTQEAGECFVAQATRGDQTYIAVVLNSPNRFTESSTLLNWAFANYTSETKPLSAW